MSDVHLFSLLLNETHWVFLATMITDGIDSIVKANLIESPLVLATLLITSCAYYYILCKSIGSLLQDGLKNSGRADNLERLSIVERIDKILVVGNFTGIVTLSLAVWSLFVNCADGSTTECKLLLLFVPLLAAVHLMSLVSIQFYFGVANYRHEMKKMRAAVHVIKAAVYLTSGKKITGGLMDLNVLKDYDHFTIRFDNGELHCIRIDCVSRIYLQDNVIDHEALQVRKFNRGPGTFLLNSRPDEKYEDVFFYDTPRFRVIKTFRKDTNTRFVIAPGREVLSARETEAVPV
jgi:hypothetical protein